MPTWAGRCQLHRAKQLPKSGFTVQLEEQASTVHEGGGHRGPHRATQGHTGAQHCMGASSGHDDRLPQALCWLVVSCCSCRSRAPWPTMQDVHSDCLRVPSCHKAYHSRSPCLPLQPHTRADLRLLVPLPAGPDADAAAERQQAALEASARALAQGESVTYWTDFLKVGVWV